jgi:4-hydroxy-L-threonine phosphate dehydrogenase PdxA
MTSTIPMAIPMAITMGDASGVGPEIVLRRAAEGAFDTEPVVVYGDVAVLRHGAELIGVDVEIVAIGAATAPAPCGRRCALAGRRSSAR